MRVSRTPSDWLPLDMPVGVIVVFYTLGTTLIVASAFAASSLFGDSVSLVSIPFMALLFAGVAYVCVSASNESYEGRGRDWVEFPAALRKMDMTISDLERLQQIYKRLVLHDEGAFWSKYRRYWRLRTSKQEEKFSYLTSEFAGDSLQLQQIFVDSMIQLQKLGLSPEEMMTLLSEYNSFLDAKVKAERAAAELSNLPR